MGLGCEWRHARKQWAGNLVIFEKAVSWDLSLGEASWDSDLGEASLVVVYGMRRAFVGSVSWNSDSGPWVQLGSWLKDDVETVSKVKIVSLSPRVERLNSRSQETFRTWTKRVVSVSGFICIWTFYVSVYLYIRILDILHNWSTTHISSGFYRIVRFLSTNLSSTISSSSESLTLIDGAKDYLSHHYFHLLEYSIHQPFHCEQRQHGLLWYRLEGGLWF